MREIILFFDASEHLPTSQHRMHHRSHTELEYLIPPECLQPVCKVLKRRVETVFADYSFFRRFFGGFAALFPYLEFDIKSVFAAKLASAGGDGFEARVYIGVREGAVTGVQSDMALENLEGEKEVGVGEAAGAEDTQVVFIDE